MHSRVTIVLSVALILLGIAMLARVIVDGGAITSYGVLIGVLFVAAGVGRIYVQRKLP